MKLAAVALAMAVAFPAAAQNRILIGLEPTAVEADADAVIKLHKGKRLEKLNKINVHVVELPPQANPHAIAAQMRGRKGISFVQVDEKRPLEYMPNDVAVASGWHLSTIGAFNAWDRAKGDGIVMAVCDTGVDPHPDLQLVSGGWNTYDNNANTADVHGHGTKVAGSVAMIGDNSVGGAGIAFKARIMPFRVSSPDGWAFDSAIAQCITKAADAGARGANASYGVCTSPVVINAAQYMRQRGGVVTISAGNSGAQMTSPNSNALTCVGATDSGDNRAGWSNYGPTVDVMAPGDNIYTTTKGEGYGGASGTSFSAPVTLGVYALMMSANPQLTPSELDNILFTTAKDLGEPGQDGVFSYGRVDAAAAVARAAGQSGNTLAAPTNVRIVQ